MTTFSQLVDALVVETRRPDLRNEIVSYTNQTLREVHSEPERNRAVLYRENLRELLLTATVDSGFGFDVPNPANFQAMQAVHYMTCNVWPPEVTPSRALADMTAFYYRAGSRYSFSGYGGQNALIALAYYEFPRRLTYFPAGGRPCEYYDVAESWTYAAEFDATPELQAAARLYCTNWLLIRWRDTIAEGVRAKVYKRVSDTDRAKTCYSMYMAMRMGLYSSEVADLGGFQ